MSSSLQSERLSSEAFSQIQSDRSQSQHIDMSLPFVPFPCPFFTPTPSVGEIATAVLTILVGAQLVQAALSPLSYMHG